MTDKVLPEEGGQIQVLHRQVGDGIYVGTTVDVLSMPDVTVTSMPDVAVTSLPDVTIAAMPNVTVSAMPDVTIAAMPYVDVATMPDINIASMPNTTVTMSGGMTDAFGRLRVSSPTTIFDGKNLIDNQPLLFDDAQVSGAYTSSSYSTATASVTLGVGNLAAGLRARQGKRRVVYQPGKSQLAFFTFTFGAAATGITRRVGLFDGNDGIFLRQTASAVQLVIRNSNGNTEDAKAQADWNVDTLPSLNLAKSQIFFIDFEWLGVGTVRCGFVINGELHYVHHFHHANLSTGVYMATPNLPPRWDIQNDGTGGAATLEAICCSVISEGGHEFSGVTRTIDRAATPLTTLNDADLYPLIAIRLRSGALSATVRASSMSVFCTSTATFRWALLLNPSVAGTALSYTAVTNSAIDAAVGSTNATKVSGGTLIASGYCTTTETSIISATGNTDIALGAKIDGTSDVIVLAVQRLTGTTETFYATLGYTEQI